MTAPIAARDVAAIAGALLVLSTVVGVVQARDTLQPRLRRHPVGNALQGPRSGVPPHPRHRLDLVIGRALKPPAPGTSFEGGHDG